MREEIRAALTACPVMSSVALCLPQLATDRLQRPFSWGGGGKPACGCAAQGQWPCVAAEKVEGEDGRRGKEGAGPAEPEAQRSLEVSCRPTLGATGTKCTPGLPWGPGHSHTDCLTPPWGPPFAQECVQALGGVLCGTHTSKGIKNLFLTKENIYKHLKQNSRLSKWNPVK